MRKLNWNTWAPVRQRKRHLALFSRLMRCELNNSARCACSDRSSVWSRRKKRQKRLFSLLRKRQKKTEGNNEKIEASEIKPERQMSNLPLCWWERRGWRQNAYGNWGRGLDKMKRASEERHMLLSLMQSAVSSNEQPNNTVTRKQHKVEKVKENSKFPSNSFDINWPINSCEVAA